MTSLIGAQGHGSDILAVWSRVHKSKLLSVYDDDPELHILPPGDLGGDVIYGINDPHGRLLASVRHKRPGAKPLVDPSVVIGDRVKLSLGVFVGPNVTMLYDVKLGPHVHVGYHASMTRCRIKGFTTICPGVTIAGDVSIGHRVFVGAGAVISNLCEIGHDVVIGAGAIIPPNSVIPDGSRVVGVWKR